MCWEHTVDKSTAECQWSCWCVCDYDWISENFRSFRSALNYAESWTVSNSNDWRHVIRPQVFLVLDVSVIYTINFRKNWLHLMHWFNFFRCFRLLYLVSGWYKGVRNRKKTKNVLINLTFWCPDINSESAKKGWGFKVTITSSRRFFSFFCFLLRGRKRQSHNICTHCTCCGSDCLYLWRSSLMSSSLGNFIRDISSWQICFRGWIKYYWAVTAYRYFGRLLLPE